MAFDYAGKTVWITGASSGIGEALALEAARRGARLVLTARRRALLERVAESCSFEAGRAGSGAPPATVLEADLSERAARVAACEALLALAEPDVAVLNAGVSQRSTFLETSPEAFDAIMAIDFEAPAELARLLLPTMLRRGSGSLVALSSLAGLAGAPLRPAYSAAKHALAGLFQCLRAELAGSGLRIVTVYPGFVRTPIARSSLGPGGLPSGGEDPDIDAGADPARVARRILDAALRGRVEIKVGFGAKGRIGLFLARRLPSTWAGVSARRAGLGDRGRRISDDAAGDGREGRIP